MRRREFFGFLSAIVALPVTARAQQSAKVYRVGLLSGGSPAGPQGDRNKSLASALAQRGFVEGRNVVFERRWANGRVEGLGPLAAELQADKVDVIVTFGYPAALAAKMSANSTPTVISGAGDPVATGLVDGLARPGGNLTGVTELSTELSAKRLEILKDAVPGLAVVAMLWNVADLGMTLRYRAAEDAARMLGVKVQTLGVREPNDFEQAFSAMTRQRPDAILMVSDALTVLNRKRVVEFAAANRLPTIFENSEIVREGGLMSYGPSQSAIGERVAELVAHILQGARPADLPLELPTRFELFINLKTAKHSASTCRPCCSAAPTK